MGFQTQDIGAVIKPLAGINPTNDDAAAALNGAALDRHLSGNAESCVLHAACGAAAGAPTAQTVDAKLQDSADGSTGWADVTGAAVTQMTGDDEEQEVDVNLRTVKRYIRAVVTVTLTAGTTPTIPVAASVIFGGAQEEPI